ELNRSGLTDLNQFASPDGMAFDSRGVLWIQTDNGEKTLTDYTNDQMLAVIPANLVDQQGREAPLNVQTQGELRRFFVGPNGCEVTGLAFTPDNLTMFVNIQHPANWPLSDDATQATPAGTQVRPRAATVVIQRIDGRELAACAPNGPLGLRQGRRGPERAVRDPPRQSRLRQEMAAPRPQATYGVPP